MGSELADVLLRASAGPARDNDPLRNAVVPLATQIMANRDKTFGDRVGESFGYHDGQWQAPGVADAISAAMWVLPGAKGLKSAPPVERLPLDTASRMERAGQMGFRTNMPLYHGTAPQVPFAEFDPAMRGAATQVRSSRQGVWAATDPALAAEHAAGAAARTGGQPQTYPLLHRTERPANIHLTGKETEAEVAATLKDAWSRGYDAVRINYPKGGPAPSIVVRDESQLRSPFAAFDPAKKYSRNLLASTVPAAGTSLAAILANRQDGS